MRGSRLAELAIDSPGEELHDAATADLAPSLGESHEVVEGMVAAKESMRAIAGYFTPTNNPSGFYLVTEERDAFPKPLQDGLTRASFEFESRNRDFNRDGAANGVWTVETYWRSLNFVEYRGRRAGLQQCSYLFDPVQPQRPQLNAEHEFQTSLTG